MNAVHTIDIMNKNIIFERIPKFTFWFVYDPSWLLVLDCLEYAIQSSGEDSWVGASTGHGVGLPRVCNAVREYQHIMT